MLLSLWQRNLKPSCIDCHAYNSVDARFIKDYCTVAEFGLVGQTMHKADERMAVADLEALTGIYEAILDDYFGGGT